MISRLIWRYRVWRFERYMADLFEEHAWSDVD